MPSAVPQTLWTEAGSTVALGSPRPHTWLHVTEVTLQSLRGHPCLPDLPPRQPPLPLMNFTYQKLHFCAWLTFMVEHGVPALESLKHGYFTHSLSKLSCLHLLTLDLDFPLSSPAPVPNPHRVWLSLSSLHQSHSTYKQDRAISSLLVLPHHIVQSLQVCNNTKLKLRRRNQRVKHIKQGD